MAYADGTKVPVKTSRDEIENMVAKHGGDQILVGAIDGKSIVQFRARNRYIRLTIYAATERDRKVGYTPTGQERTGKSLATALDQENRRRWRSMALLVKAKFTAIDDGIVSFEDEWLAETVMANGQTVKEQIQPQLAASYDSGEMGPLQISFRG